MKTILIFKATEHNYLVISEKQANANFILKKSYGLNPIANP